MPRIFLAFAALAPFATQAHAQSLGSAEDFGAYTAIVADKDGGTGVALAELYHLE